MFKNSYGEITIAAILDTRRNDKNGNFPIKIRVGFRRDRKYFSTGKKLTEQEWEALPETKGRKWADIKENVQATYKNVEKVVEILHKEGNFSFDALNVRLGKCVDDTVNAKFRSTITKLNAAGRMGTHSSYLYALKSFEKYRGANIQFSAVTADWLKGYESFMLKDGKTLTTIGIHLRALKAIINDAKSAGAIKESQYPFGDEKHGKYQIKTGSGRKMALSFEQLKSIMDFCDGSKTTERYRDLFVFSYLCNGINFADLISLKYTNIQDGEIYYLRQKTIRTAKEQKEIRATITPPMEAIIKKWGNPDKKPSNFIFQYLDGTETPKEKFLKTRGVICQTNLKLKEIGTALNIGNISTYTARHSFATVLKNSGANIAYISESLGHTDLKTTEHYLKSFEKKEREKNAALLY